jgi:serine/threonine protein kinase
LALTAGTRLGPYEIVSALGAGGMGEVYRARDAKLDRDVAIKVLPAAFVSDPERVARFQREAKTLASLNHPNIAAIYGLDESDGAAALVLELVEGPTLADRIAQGPIPLDEALPIARQIADALEAAHEHGIIHRDLKPANIKLRPDGAVKVLDFGLAKALAPDPGSATGVHLSQPTITSPAAMTGAGMLLGTAAYMSPEQAKARPADKRSDVWAFGCVLYEMLTGARAFCVRGCVRHAGVRAHEGAGLDAVVTRDTCTDSPAVASLPGQGSQTAPGLRGRGATGDRRRVDSAHTRCARRHDGRAACAPLAPSHSRRRRSHRRARRLRRVDPEY